MPLQVDMGTSWAFRQETARQESECQLPTSARPRDSTAGRLLLLGMTLDIAPNILRPSPLSPHAAGGQAQSSAQRGAALLAEHSRAPEVGGLRVPDVIREELHRPRGGREGPLHTAGGKDGLLGKDARPGDPHLPSASLRASVRYLPVCLSSLVTHPSSALHASSLYPGSALAASHHAAPTCHPLSFLIYLSLVSC